MRDKKPETFRDYGISCNWEQKELWKVWQLLLLLAL